MSLDNSLHIMQGVFDDMDKDFTIWEYKEDIKKLLDCGYFVQHIINHIRKENLQFPVLCKICNKSFDEIVEKEKL